MTYTTPCTSTSACHTTLDGSEIIMHLPCSHGSIVFDLVMPRQSGVMARTQQNEQLARYIINRSACRTCNICRQQQSTDGGNSSSFNSRVAGVTEYLATDGVTGWTRACALHCLLYRVLQRVRIDCRHVSPWLTGACSCNCSCLQQYGHRYEHKSKRYC